MFFIKMCGVYTDVYYKVFITCLYVLFPLLFYNNTFYKIHKEIYKDNISIASKL